MKTLILTLLLASSMAHATRLVVEAKRPLSEKEMKNKPFKVEAFYKTSHPYFSRLYVVSGNVDEKALTKLSWVKKVEPTLELTKLSLLPGENPQMLVSDELFPYQWGLLNQGQTYILEKDDIHNIPMKGVDNKDIGWKDLYQITNKTRPIVAVLDSGVDLTHPELQGNLWENVKECGKDPKVDNDNNKLAGDCHGWNFTEAMDADEAKDPSDSDGHGTHVSGIIAAARNGSGTVGVSPNALIMPLKVMKDSDSKSQVASSESFANGILYATENGAHVINMSLGWPRSLETDYLRKAVFYALSKGVIIVAAAGNNNSSEPLFPCAYDGVVCVAASTLNGTFAGFSNYGSHVDTIAPGEGILSLAPTMYEPEFFSVPGFDIKSGTSQAAPFVSGLLASLKANKQVSNTEIFGRLYQAASNQDKKKYILGGEATWASVSTEIKTPIIRPVMKRVRQILLRSGVAEVKLTIPVRNYGLDSGPFTVQVESLSKSIEFINGPIELPGLKSGDGKDVSFNVKIVNILGESSVKIKVTITDELGSNSFINEIPVVRDIRADFNFKRLGFAFTDKQIPVGGVKEGIVNSFLSTMESYVKNGRHDLFLKRSLKDGDKKKMEFTIFSRKGDKYIQAPGLIFVNNATNLVNFIRVDLNRDGVEDYFIQTLAEDNGKKFFTFSFYTEDMKPVWKDFQDVTLTLDQYLQSMNEIVFTKFEHPTLGKMMVPAFFTDGQLPKVDQVISSWEKYDVTKKGRLFWLEPKEKEFRIRTFTTNVWEKLAMSELKSLWYETVMTEALLPVSTTDAQNGELRVLVSIGHMTKRQIFIYTFDTAKSSHGAKLPQLVLQAESAHPLLSVSQNGLSVEGDVSLNIYDRTRAKLVTTRDQAQVTDYVYRHDAETDIIAGHIASFENGEAKFSILQTREKLISVTTKGTETQISMRPKLRYSFLSQKLLSELYYPVVYKRDNAQAPALYVDATAVTGNRVYLFEEQNGELVSSIKNSLVIPANCKALNPYFSRTTNTHEFIFLCLEDKEWAIRTFEMN